MFKTQNPFCLNEQNETIRKCFYFSYQLLTVFCPFEWSSTSPEMLLLMLQILFNDYFTSYNKFSNSKLVLPRFETSPLSIYCMPFLFVPYQSFHVLQPKTTVYEFVSIKWIIVDQHVKWFKRWTVNYFKPLYQNSLKVLILFQDERKSSTFFRIFQYWILFFWWMDH